MKRILLLVLITVFAVYTFAQEKKEVILLERNVDILQIMKFPQNGIVIKTGKDFANTKALDWTLYYYNLDLTLRYKVDLEKTQINKGFENYFVSSPVGNIIYHIEPKGYNTTFGVSSHFITQIDEKGNKKTYEFEKIKELGKVNAKFADSKFLYYLTEDKVKEESEKKKVGRIMFVKLNASDFLRTDVEVQLPEPRDKKYSSGYAYWGNSENKIYFVSKTVNGDDGTLIYDIATVDGEGKVIGSVNIDANLGDKFPRASSNEKHFFWARYDDPDFITSHYYSATNGASMSIGATEHAFGSLVIDEKNNSIYTYGLTGPPVGEFQSPFVEGYFIQKYDLKGKLLWKRQYSFEPEVLKDKHIRVNQYPFKKFTKLTINTDNSLKFQVMAKDNVYTYNLDSEGSFQSTYFKAWGSFNTYEASENSPSVKFLSNNNAKLTKMYFRSINKFEKSEILILYGEKDRSFNLLLFNK